MRQINNESLGRTGHIRVCGKLYRCASGAEKRWLEIIEPILKAGEAEGFEWQPGPYPVTYRHCGETYIKPYTPDAKLKFTDDTQETIIEIKRGYMKQSSCAKLKRFCQQYPQYQVVLVWMGSLPKSGVAKKRLDTLRPHLSHIWQIK